MRLTAAERRRELHRAPPGGQLVMGDHTIDLGSYDELLTLYRNRVAGEEEIRGRKAWVIESAPLPGRAAAGEHQRDVLSFRRKLWMDEADDLPARLLYTVTGNGIHFAQPGSTIQADFIKIAADVWCQSSIVLDMWRASGKSFRPWKRTEIRNHDFQKFDVQSTVTAIHP